MTQLPSTDLLSGIPSNQPGDMISTSTDLSTLALLSRLYPERRDFFRKLALGDPFMEAAQEMFEDALAQPYGHPERVAVESNFGLTLGGMRKAAAWLKTRAADVNLDSYVQKYGLAEKAARVQQRQNQGGARRGPFGVVP